MWRKSTIGIYFFVILLEWSKICVHGKESQLSTSQIADLTRRCEKNPTKPSVIFTDSNPCDTERNCRFGGSCWKTIVNTTTHEKEMHQIYQPGEGVCRCAWSCPEISRRSPKGRGRGHVCGTDGRTYENECKLKLTACRCQYPLDIKWHASCEKGPKIEEIKIVENLVYDTFDEEGSGSGEDLMDEMSWCHGVICRYGAVCDSDAEDGPCLCAIECHDTSSHKVCGSDGRTYQNECFVKQSACQEQTYIAIDHERPCSTMDEISLPDITTEGSGDEDTTTYADTTICATLQCEGELVREVCGSDGKTYINQCSLRYAGCRKQQDIRVVHAGFCDPTVLAETNNHDSVGRGKENGTSSPCTSIYCFHGAVCVPVGTKDFKCSCDAICSKDSFATHEDSWSSLGGINGEEMQVFLNGKASDLIDAEKQDFGNIEPPITTKILLQDENHEPRIESLDNTQLFASGESLPSDSLRLRRSTKHDNEVVCGTDGKTYENECQMKIFACRAKKDIKVKKRGECPYGPVETSTNSTESSFSAPSTTVAQTTVSIPSTSAIQTKDNVTKHFTKAEIKEASPNSRKTTHVFPATSEPDTHTDSQTKKIISLAHTENTKAESTRIEKTVVTRLPDLKNEEENDSFEIENPGAKSSSAKHSWLIWVIVSIVVIIAVIVLGACFLKNYLKELKIIIKNGKESSRKSLVVVSTNDGEATTSATATAKDPLNVYV